MRSDVYKKCCIKNYVFSSTIYVYSEHGSFYKSSKQSAECIIQEFCNTFEINFYAIVMNYRGSKGLVGTVPSRKSRFNFYRDKLYNHELGEISYTIYPVYNNMRVGKPIETNVVKREREVSEQLLRRMLERKASREETSR